MCFNSFKKLKNNTHIQTGKYGEFLAVNFLKKNNFTILEKNKYLKKSEIDIIATKENYLVFIEVKTRTSNQFGSPIDAVSEKKQQMLINGAQQYIEENDTKKEVRFDIIAILLDKHQAKIKHIKNAFTPSW